MHLTRYQVFCLGFRLLLGSLRANSRTRCLVFFGVGEVVWSVSSCFHVRCVVFFQKMLSLKHLLAGFAVLQAQASGKTARYLWLRLFLCAGAPFAFGFQVQKEGVWLQSWRVFARVYFVWPLTYLVSRTSRFVLSYLWPYCVRPFREYDMCFWLLTLKAFRCFPLSH